MSKSPLARRADLRAALKRLKKNDTITLEEVARLWGVSKARFVNVRNEIADFPDPIEKHGNAYLYSARPVVECLLRYETRNDKISAGKASKVARILGNTAEHSDEDAPLPASEMLALARTGAEIDRRKRDQGELLKASDVQEVVGEVFGKISTTLSKLSDQVDPNGRLPAQVRSILDGLGKDLLLRLYDDLNDMLGGNANVTDDRTKTARKRPDRSRGTKVRSVRKGGRQTVTRKPASRRVDSD